MLEPNRPKRAARPFEVRLRVDVEEPAAQLATAHATTCVEHGLNYGDEIAFATQRIHRGGRITIEPAPAQKPGADAEHVIPRPCGFFFQVQHAPVVRDIET